MGEKGIKKQAAEFHSNFSAVRKCAQQSRGDERAVKKCLCVRVYMCVCFDVLQKLLRVEDRLGVGGDLIMYAHWLTVMLNPAALTSVTEIKP